MTPYMRPGDELDIAVFQRPAGEIRVFLGEHRGRTYLYFRFDARQEGALQTIPTGRGLTFFVHEAEELATALQAAVEDLRLPRLADGADAEEERG